MPYVDAVSNAHSTIYSENQKYVECNTEPKETIKTKCDNIAKNLLQSLDLLQSIMISITSENPEVFHPPEPVCLIDSLDINCSLARQIRERIEAFKTIIC